MKSSLYLGLALILILTMTLSGCGGGNGGGGGTATYTITYYGNGNTGGSVPKDDHLYRQGQMVTILGSIDLAKTGYILMGWNTQSDGNGVTYFEGQSFAMGTTNVSLYAKWTVPTVSTIAGLAGSYGSANGAGATAKFFQPEGIAVDDDGNLYVTDTFNSTIRKLTKSGTDYTVTTIAGTAGSTGSTNGDGLTQAKFDHPEGIAVDSNGNLYVADTNNCSIRKLTLSGSVYSVSTIASSLGYPRGIIVDHNGVVYVTDTNNAIIRKLTWNGVGYTVSTIAGASGVIGTADGDGLTQARFSYPEGIAMDRNGNLYVTDANKHTIRKLTWTGTVYTVTTIAGTSGSPGIDDGTGTMAGFSTPRGITVDSSGNLIYVADTNNSTLRKMTRNGTTYTVTTIAGKAYNSGSTDGVGSDARFSGPYGITVDKTGNLFVVDMVNHTIRMITFN